MKKAFILLVVVFSVCLAFAACGCEHTYEAAVTTEASCTAVGVKTYTCTQCQDSYTEDIPMIEHTYASTVTKEATCTEKGVTTFTCAACNDSYTEEIDLIAHTFGEATVTKEPTCVEEGEKTAICTVCGVTEVAEKIPTVVHTYKSKEKVAATCTEKGVNTLTCSVCQHSKEESVKALGHKYKQSKVLTKVTCTSDGEVTMTCSRCKDSYNETKKATGHNWVAASCTKAKYCKNCNQTEGSALGHTTQNGKCGRCGKKISLASSCKLSLPSMPVSLNTQYGNAKITKCKGTFQVLGNGQLNLYLDIYGTCGFSSREGAWQTICRAVITDGKNTYKIPVSDSLYSESSFSCMKFFSNIEPGEYKLTFEEIK